MSRITKLYEKLLAGRRIDFRELEALLSAFGWVHRRTRGSHHTYSHPLIAENLVIQPRGKDAMPYQVATFLDMVQRYGLKLDTDA